MNKNKILILVLVVISQISNAQFYLGAGTGSYTLKNNFENFSISNATGSHIKAGYVKMFNKNVGVGVGIENSRNHCSFKANKVIEISTNRVDDASSAFVYNTTTKGYREIQEMHALSIPLFVQYKKMLNSTASVYARVGTKYYMPQNIKSIGYATKVTATGYYPDFNLLVSDMPEHGFGTTNVYRGAGEYATKDVFMLNLELGFSFKTGGGSIYAGFFLDRATKSIINNPSIADVLLVGYNPLNITSRALGGIYNTKTDGEVLPVNAGFTIAYSFGK